MSTPSDIQSLLDSVRGHLTAAFNDIIQIGKLAEAAARAGQIQHIPRGTNQAVFNAVAPHIPKIAPGIAAEMGRNRTREYSAGPVESWGLSTADYDDAIARLRAAGLLD